ncbi:unnamed protein product [Rhizoctonia solani]|uniref:Uncharacterized protein n=1 Tax=Rhizoctonia solani TaxID=456999 RepID=A0A8H3A350_9AGAM|nr:unnamed protein product [Rhizoctonia solani]
MGRSKKQKAAAAKDEPGPDDYIFLILFFPVGRSGAKMVRDDDPKDISAAQRIGRWMHEAGLPIRKLFSRKSVDQVIVEVRKEIPEDIINSKLGAYKWVDTIVDASSIPQDYRDCETTVLRARIRSHDAVEKIGGMVYYPIDPIIPTGPRSESLFRYPFPKPKRVGYTVPTTSTIVGYYPLPPELTVVVENDNIQPDVKPDIKPRITPPAGVDVKPVVSHDASQASDGNNEPQAETKPRLEADVKPKVEEPPAYLNIDMNPIKDEGLALKTEPIVRPDIDMNPSVEERLEQESLLKREELVVPNFDMNPSAEERIERPVNHEEPIVPDADANPSAEERLEQERLGLKQEESTDQPERPNELGPTIEPNETPTGPPEVSREPEAPPTVKAEPQQQPIAQKRPAESAEVLERGKNPSFNLAHDLKVLAEVKRERLT